MLVEAMTRGREVERASRIAEPPEEEEAEAERHRGSEMFLESLAGLPLLPLLPDLAEAESRLLWSLVEISSREWEPPLLEDLCRWPWPWWWRWSRFWHLHLAQVAHVVGFGKAAPPPPLPPEKRAAVAAAAALLVAEEDRDEDSLSSPLSSFNTERRRRNLARVRNV